MGSLFGALDTAVSGLTAQSAAFGNISDNVANSQTTGYKEIDTSFEDYLTTSNAVNNDSGFVAATPDYQNNVQGNITASTNALALAISGNGFFQVTQETSNATQATTLSNQVAYTRDGNFSLDKNGYLVNDVGQVLSGWSVNPATGVANQNQVAPLQINQSAFAPVATQNVTLNANLPATPAAGTGTAASPITSQVNVYDSDGTIHTVSLNWVQNADNNWTVTVVAPDAQNGTAGGGGATSDLGSATVTFGNAPAATPPAGTISSVGTFTGTTTAVAGSAATSAGLSFTANFGNGPQTINLNLGTIGGDNGVTQFAGSTYSLEGLSQDGVAPGSFSGVSMQTSGDIVANYDNGQTRIVGQVPLTTLCQPRCIAAPERPGLHLDGKLRRRPGAGCGQRCRRQPGGGLSRGLQRGYRNRIHQAHRGSAGLFRQY